MKKIFKCKNLFLVTFLAVAGFFSAAAIIKDKQVEETPVVEEAKADTYALRTYDDVFIYYCDWDSWNNNWSKYENKTCAIFAYFIDYYNNVSWSKQIVQDQYKYFHDSSDNATAYFVYPQDLSHDYTRCILVRMKNGSTSGSFDGNKGFLAQSQDITLGNTFNRVRPIGDSWSGGKCNYDTYKYTNINTDTKQAKDEIYIRDNNSWSAASAIIQIHVWGNTHMEDENYFNVTGQWVQGKYNTGDDVVGLLEGQLPLTGRWRWIQFKRLNPSGGGTWNQTGDKNFSSTNNVFNTTAINDGSFTWNVSDSERVNIFARYVVSETGKVCTDNPSQSDLSPALEAHWGYTKTQYGYMSATNQGAFYVATPGTSNDLQKGALRYDRLVYLYGKNKDTGARIGTRSGRLEDYVNRHANSSAYYYGSIRSFSPIELIVGADKEADTTVILIIVMSSISILSITALSVLMVKKRKSKQQ